MKKQLKRFTIYIPVNAAYFFQNILNYALTTHMHETLNQTDKPPFLPAVIAHPGNSIFSRLRRQPVHPLLYPAAI
jgi:hypothetical protein